MGEQIEENHSKYFGQNREGRCSGEGGKIKKDCRQEKSQKQI